MIKASFTADFSIYVAGTSHNSWPRGVQLAKQATPQHQQQQKRKMHSNMPMAGRTTPITIPAISNGVREQRGWLPEMGEGERMGASAKL